MRTSELRLELVNFDEGRSLKDRAAEVIVLADSRERQIWNRFYAGHTFGGSPLPVAVPPRDPRAEESE